MIYPIEYFFSALLIVCRRTLSPLGVRVLACIKDIPYGFGLVGLGHGESVGEDGDGDGELAGKAVESLGEDGRPGCRVRVVG